MVDMASEEDIEEELLPVLLLLVEVPGMAAIMDLKQQQEQEERDGQEREEWSYCSC